MAERLAGACVIATLAFWAYTQTLHPGVDLGDTGGFQAAVLWPEVSARQAYPLYYNLARPFVAAGSPDDPARALNLFSAAAGALAVGLLVFACAAITGSLAAGMTAGLFLAFSYTFWTQAIIAEVYTLHLALVGLCLVTLWVYDRRPTTLRLAAFLAVYALSFGNHLSMVLLLLPFTVFLLRTPERRRDLLRPGIVALAVAIAVAGALQYLPNLLAVWSSPEAPAGWTGRLAAFWVDTTKADWRESMVLGVRADQMSDRVAMWWFDLRQQFGLPGIALALFGSVALWRASRAWAALLIGIYAIASLFAFTYNVGDTHVFFLPAHYVLAFLAGAAISAVTASRLRATGIARAVAPTAIALTVVYAGWRGWSTWPAVDRHDDRRAEQLATQLTLGISDRDAVLVSKLNWQIENLLLYYARYGRHDLAWVRMEDVRPHFPRLIEDNRRISRDLVMHADAAAEAATLVGSDVPVIADGSIGVSGLSEIGLRVPAGAPYVLALLTPPREIPLDPDLLNDALAALTEGQPPEMNGMAFQLVAGVAGQRPSMVRFSNRPFTTRFVLEGQPITVRMDSWLPTDTFRRAGFGHVLSGRQRILTLERGFNLVWLDGNGTASAPFYAASLWAPQPRYRIPAATLELAHWQPNGALTASSAAVPAPIRARDLE